jgi:multiple sugar transport system ATP-binding protein
MAQITCRKLTKRYGNVVAVEALDLEIRDREFLVLLGPSGCGKTTTLNIIAGLEELSHGELLFDGEVVNDVPPHRRNVAMVFQSYALYPQKSVFDNVAFALRLKGMGREEIARRVREVAEQLEIAHLLERRPAELSGGQRQRVALGRAIVRQPSVFLMDEPLSNLDAALRVSMRTLIKKLHQSMGTTFVYVTHDQAEAMMLADRIAVMNNGVIQQLDTPDAIYHAPRNLFVAGFLGSPQMNFLPGEIVAKDDGVRFAHGAIRVELPQGFAAQHGRKVTLGVRPEDVAPARNGRATAFTGKVVLVSPLGSEQHVNVAIADSELVFRLDKDEPVRVGDTLGFAVEPRRLHVFDAASEANLAPG